MALKLTENARSAAAEDGVVGRASSVMTASPKPRGGVPIPPPPGLGRRFGARSILFLPLVLVFSLLAIAYIQIETAAVGGGFTSSDVSTDGGTGFATPVSFAGSSGPHRALGSHSKRVTRRQAIGNGDALGNDEVGRREWTPKSEDVSVQLQKRWLSHH